MADALKKGKMKEARKINGELGGSESDLNTAVVRDANIMDVMEMLDEMDASQKAEFLALPETKSAAKEALTRHLSVRTIDGALQTIATLELSADDLQSPELQVAAQASAMETLKRGNHRGFFRLVDAFHLSEEFLASEELRAAIKEGKTFLLSRQSRPEELAAGLTQEFAEKGLGHLLQDEKASE